MATKNPRVAAYIQPTTHEKLKAYMIANNLTESKAIDVILGEFFGVEVPRVTVGVSPSSLPSNIDERLTLLERVDVVGLLEDAIAPLRSELEALRLELGEYVA
jgi:hypothetical protein